MRARLYFVMLALSFIGLSIYTVIDIRTASHADQHAARTVPNSPFVSSYGDQLYLNGSPYYFHGLDIYNVTSQNNGCWYPFEQNIGANLDAIGTGQTAFRGWFFQQEATIGGKRNWGAFDNVLGAAAARGEHVIVVLSNEWNTCEPPYPQPQYKPEPWYQTGYRTEIEPGYLQTYRDWVISVVSRYKDDPTILEWQLMNEPEDELRHYGACPSTAFTTMSNWITDMTTLVKSIDPNHLVGLGTIGTGQCPFNNSQYQRLMALPGIDLCDFHDYFPTSTIMSGDQYYSVSNDVNICKAIGKPLIVGEAGIRGSDVHGSLTVRANDFATKFRAYCTIGISGALIWNWRAGSEGGSSQVGYWIGPGDPTLNILGLNYCNQNGSKTRTQLPMKSPVQALQLPLGDLPKRA